MLDDLRRVTHFARMKERQFAEYINQKNTLELRREINALRGDGIPICSFDGGTTMPPPRRSCGAPSGSSAAGSKKVAFAERGLSRTLPDYEDTGQLSLPLEGGDTS